MPEEQKCKEARAYLPQVYIARDDCLSGRISFQKASDRFDYLISQVGQHEKDKECVARFKKIIKETKKQIEKELKEKNSRRLYANQR